MKRVLALFAVSVVLISQAIFGESAGFAADPVLIPYEPCEIVDQAPCIESLTLIDFDGKRFRAFPDGPITPLTYEFARQKSTPTKTYQWRVPGIKHESNSDMLTLHVYHFPYGANYCWSETACTTQVDETVIYLFASGWEVPAPKVDIPNSDNDLVCGNSSAPEKCIRMWSLNPDYRYEVVLRPLPSFDFSHANGEAMNGMVRSELNSKGEKILRFSGEPVDFSYTIVNDLKPLNPNQTRADVTYKYVGVYAHTTKSGQSAWLSRCNYGREMSLWYSGQLQSMPQWIASDSALTLQVSSTHFRADNSLNKGVFNIDMPIETAKCLWGVDLSQAVSASISASYPDLGISEIITTTSKVDGKFFKVSAAGFHFSAPTIKMKLTQDAPVASPSRSPLPSVAAATKRAAIKIKCTKGKTTKTFLSSTGKCPSGYKKVN